jgi:hypothetical protein
MVFPWEGRDQQELAELRYSNGAKHRRLEQENLKLKKLLREHGIAWSPTAKAHLDAVDGFNPAVNGDASAKPVRRTRAAKPVKRLPHLPTEVILRIMHYAFISEGPIVDAMSPTSKTNLTPVERKARRECVALGFLATCKFYHTEALRMLFQNNSFVFTTPQALLNFAEVSITHRKFIKHVTLRVIARFYDDETRPHKLQKEYHNSMTRDENLRVSQRAKEPNLARKGFRCYTWTQVIDFLDALRAPYDPKHEKGTPRPRLFPDLESMRIDFVNFPEYYLPFSDSDLHELAAHDLGCTLNELTVTGLPSCEVGMKAGGDLSGMVKDDGLFMESVATFMQSKGGMLKPMTGGSVNARVIRSWRKQARDAREARAAAAAKNLAHAASSSTAAAGGASATSSSTPASHSTSSTHGNEHSHGYLDMPPAPEDKDAPPCTRRKRKTVWRRVPVLRDSEEREWIEFDRQSGYPIESIADIFSDTDEDEDGYFCIKCGDYHPAYDMDDDEEDFDDFEDDI